MAQLRQPHAQGHVEHALRARLEAVGADTSRVMDEHALARFFDPYERFTAQAAHVMPARAQATLHVHRAHAVVGLTLARQRV